MKATLFTYEDYLKLEDRLDIVKGEGIFGTPDLVVKVVSPNTFKKDTEDKRRIYAQFSIKEYWLVFPEEKGKVCSKVLEGFCIDLGEVFL